MKNSLLRVNDVIYLSCIWVAGLSVTGMALIIPWGIFARYVLRSGAGWPEPVAILLMAIFTFVGAAASYRAGAHMAVTTLTDRLPAALQRYVDLLDGRLGTVVVVADARQPLFAYFEVAPRAFERRHDDAPASGMPDLQRQRNHVADRPITVRRLHDAANVFLRGSGQGEGEQTEGDKQGE